MAIRFELPTDLERELRERLGNLDAVAKEATLVGLYRQFKLTHRQLSEALGLTRLETEGVLKRYNVTEDLMTVEEYEANRARHPQPVNS